MMKKIQLLFALVLGLSLLAMPIMAQDTFIDKLGVGGRIGITLTDAIDHPSVTDQATNYHLGGVAHYPLFGGFSFQMELMIVGKGYEVPDTVVFQTITPPGQPPRDTAIAVSTSRSPVYIEIPLLFRYSISLSETVKPFINGGGFGSMKVIETARINDGINEYEVDTGIFKTFDAGFLFGGGIEFRTGYESWVFLEARYEQSVTSMRNGYDFKNKALYFSIGYWFK